MRTRAIALMAAATLAASPAAIITADAAAKAKKHHAGQACNPKKKAPKGFRCMKNKKGKFVLTKKK